MKVGKEGVAGAIAALEAWMTDDRDQARETLNARLQRVESCLKKIAGINVSMQGTQIKLEIDRTKASVSAYGLARTLFAADPAIIVWSQFAREGILLLTFGKVSDAVADHVCERITAICAAGSDATESVPNIGDAIADQLQEWPVALKRS
jgi:L-seryl-tRNA(Ser) seleniumtransferase